MYDRPDMSIVTRLRDGQGLVQHITLLILALVAPGAESGDSELTGPAPLRVNGRFRPPMILGATEHEHETTRVPAWYREYSDRIGTLVGSRAVYSAMMEREVVVGMGNDSVAFSH